MPEPIGEYVSPRNVLAERIGSYLYGYDGGEELVPWDDLVAENPERLAYVKRGAALADEFDLLIEDAAITMSSGDVLTAWRVRNAALAVAASFVHPGPDWEDEQARKRLVREWVSDGHDQVEEENRQRLVAIQRMIAAEALVADLLDEDPCHYDHHGYCQAHNLHHAPCPHERARALLAHKNGSSTKEQA